MSAMPIAIKIKPLLPSTRHSKMCYNRKTKSTKECDPNIIQFCFTGSINLIYIPIANVSKGNWRSQQGKNIIEAFKIAFIHHDFLDFLSKMWYKASLVQQLI